MKKRNRFIAVLALMAFLVIPTRSAQAQGPNDQGKLVVGENYTLESGETLEGDLIVFGGNVTVESDAAILGSVVVFGGNMDVAEDASIHGDTAMIGGTMELNGIVQGDIVILGGRISLTDTAIVRGDISAMGGEIERDPDAQVEGEVFENVPAPSVHVPSIPAIPNVPQVPGVPNVPGVPEIQVNYNPFWEAGMVIVRALVVAALAMLLTLFLQPQLERVSDAIVRQPFVAGSFGLLTVILAPIVLLVLIVTLILIPVAALAAIVLPLAWLFGVIALGQEVGERFAKAVNQVWAPVVATGAGTFLLMLVGGYVGMIPCVGWLLPFIVGLVGIGGVIMTWFGTRPGPGTALSQPVEVPPAS